MKPSGNVARWALSCGLAMGCQEAAARADEPEQASSRVEEAMAAPLAEPPVTEEAPYDRERGPVPAGASDARSGPPADVSPTAKAASGEPPIRVGLFRAAGVSSYAFAKSVELLSTVDGIELIVLSPRQVKRGALNARKIDVVIFTGGSGSRQGKALGEEGREQVRQWLHDGGGYVGICAGSYLAMQGEEEFNKLAILAGHNLTGDYWKRGVKDLEVVTRPNRASKDAEPQTLHLHFANGPLFEREKVESLPAYVSLADFVGETYSTRNGTNPGEMPGTPAIVASRYGKGRMVLFSPNPVLGEAGAQHPEIFLDAIEWVDVSGKFERKLGFEDVFDGIDPVRRGRHEPTPEHAELALTDATAE